MKARKKQSKKTSPFSIFFPFTALILGLLAIVFYNRTQDLKAETYQLKKVNMSCETSLKNISDCQIELQQIQELQEGLMQDKHKLVQQLEQRNQAYDSLYKHSQRNTPPPLTTSRSMTKQHKQHTKVLDLEESYNNKVMADVLRVSM